MVAAYMLVLWIQMQTKIAHCASINAPCGTIQLRPTEVGVVCAQDAGGHLSVCSALDSGKACFMLNETFKDCLGLGITVSCSNAAAQHHTRRRLALAGLQPALEPARVMLGCSEPSQAAAQNSTSWAQKALAILHASYTGAACHWLHLPR